ncbi:MAG: amidohydrolase family protein, partial [Alphaproteobacteria bacterium]
SWSDYIIELVNAYPDTFIPTANGGTNPNWLKERGGNASDFIDQMEVEIRSGKYFNMGEFDFRHYMSGSQCKKGRTERDSDIPLNGKNGHRVFKLSVETGVPFIIHLEAEDAALDALEEMLKAYPKAKVVVAHFGQIRHPEKQTRFTPKYVRRLFETYANLSFDLATGQPNRKYKCSGPGNNRVLKGDTVLWEGTPGNQKNKVQADYLSLMEDFSDRFVFATDYGGGRPPLAKHFRKKSANFNLITRDLSDDARHNMGYRNAWKLLTREAW